MVGLSPEVEKRMDIARKNSLKIRELGPFEIVKCRNSDFWLRPRIIWIGRYMITW